MVGSQLVHRIMHQKVVVVGSQLVHWMHQKAEVVGFCYQGVSRRLMTAGRQWRMTVEPMIRGTTMIW